MVMPVGILPGRVTEANLTAVMAGFGQTRVEPRTDVKQFLEMDTMTNADCRRFYRMFPFNAVRIFDSNICVMNPVGRGTCGGEITDKILNYEASVNNILGDSGGSLVINGISVSDLY
jgi:hypothetical protein